MMIFGRKVPLWATVIPLLIAFAAYGWWWNARMDRFRTEVGAALGPEVAVTYGGFPYRLHAETARTALERRRVDTLARLSVDRMRLDRQPASGALTVAGVAGARVLLEAAGIAGARAELSAPGGRASVHVDGDRLARFSAEFTGARAVLGVLPVPITAGTFEVHVRETPVAPIAMPTGPRMPVQAELRASGTGVRLGGGDPLAMEADVAVTAASPLRSARGWAAQSGTIEVRRLTLADKLGIVVDLNATVVPNGAGLRVAGAITTVCPRSVLAALSGERLAAPEYRARIAQRVAFGGPVGAVMTQGGLGAFTVRAQETPCPRLRG